MNKQQMLRSLFEPFTDAERANMGKTSIEANPPEGCKKTRVDGGEAYIFEDDAFLASGQKLGVVKQDRFAPVPLHVHNYIELIYVWSGVCRQIINGEAVVCHQGDVSILDTKTAHSIEIAGKNDIIINVLMRREYFATAFLRRITRGSSLARFLAEAASESRQERSYLLFRCHDDEEISATMQCLLYEYYFGSIGYAEAVDSYIIILFTELLRTYRSEVKTARPNSRRMRVLDILEYIENGGETRTLTQAAEAFGLHPSYLTSLLKEETGKSFVEHQQTQRLNRARILLEDTDMPVSDIIEACGYQNVSFFYKLFFKEMACTPAEYRERFHDLP